MLVWVRGLLDLPHLERHHEIKCKQPATICDQPKYVVANISAEWTLQIRDYIEGIHTQRILEYLIL